MRAIIAETRERAPFPSRGGLGRGNATNPSKIQKYDKAVRIL